MSNERENINKKAVIKRLLILSCLCIIILAMALSLSYANILKKSAPLAYEDLVDKYSSEYSVDKALIYAVMKTESGFDADAVSVDNAMGLMQITGETFEWLQTKTKEKLSEDELFKPEINIKYGAYFLKLLANDFSERDSMLAAYNAGITRVKGWLRDSQYSDDGKSLKNIPISETNYYVIKVNNAIELYERIYNFSSSSAAVNTRSNMDILFN